MMFEPAAPVRSVFPHSPCILKLNFQNVVRVPPLNEQKHKKEGPDFIYRALNHTNVL